ncbi:hypothetical protein PIB30_105376, partial [Stylosanthes scabra]|nr:hypothetical protein [Stylosanthes scabra]
NKSRLGLEEAHVWEWEESCFRLVWYKGAGHVWRKGNSRLVCENGAKRDLLSLELVTFGGGSGSRLGVLRLSFGSAKRDLRFSLGIMVVTFV